MTILTCVSGVDSDDQTTSTFSLIRQDGAEHTPGSVRDRLSKAMVLHHAFDIEFLYGDYAEAVD